MDWRRVEQVQRAALTRFLAMLCALLGIRPGEGVDTVPHAVYRAASALLQPLESALRRLIVVHARDVAAPPFPGLRIEAPGTRRIGARDGGGTGRPPRFQLFDRRKHFEPPKFARPRFPPRITLLGVDDWTPYPQPVERFDDTPRAAGPLCRRLLALHLALADLDGAARRLLRWKARREAMRKAGKKAKFTGPLRPGHPPGYRRYRQRPIDAALRDLDLLARLADRQGAGPDRLA